MAFTETSAARRGTYAEQERGMSAALSERVELRRRSYPNADGEMFCAVHGCEEAGAPPAKRSSR